MKKRVGYWRFNFIFILLIGAAVGVSARLFYLQILKHGVYNAQAQSQHELLEKITPLRGEIFIKAKKGWLPLAINRDFFKISLAPKEVKDKNFTAQKLSEILAIPESEILEKLKDADDPYELLAVKVEREKSDRINELGLKGVYSENEKYRWYPQNNLASHVTGFLGFKNDERAGQYGLEGFYDEKLSGRNGFMRSEKDAIGRWMLVNDYEFEPAQNGKDLYLSLEREIQFKTEQILKNVVQKYESPEGCAIVMEPETGAILAMASYPDFNPNEYGKAKDIDIFLNSCTQKLYEPGSVFKPIVMAAGLDSQKITPNTSYVDEGFVSIGGTVIQNANNAVYGQSSMTRVLEKSINTGVVFVERQVGSSLFRKYIEAFGFGEPTGVDVAGEIGGNLKNLDKSEVNYATASFGQGLSITPLEMISAISAIANGGKLMQPFLVEKSSDGAGEEVRTPPKILRQAITSETAAKLTAMLVSTVRNGYDKITIKDYDIAGKTGTAQIPSSDKRGYSEETIHTFVGFAPAFNPKFAILLKIDKPKGVNFASNSLPPAFSELTQFLFNYYEIPPNK